MNGIFKLPGLERYLSIALKNERIKNALVRKFTSTKYLGPIRVESPIPALNA